MDRAAVMRELKRLGKPNTARIYARHGVAEETFGVPYADLGSLARRIGEDHRLALELWQTRNHDARVLATKVASPSDMKERDFAAWLKECTNYVIVDAVSGLAARAPKAETLAKKWIEKEAEWTSAAGWNVFAILATGERIDKVLATDLMVRIQGAIHSVHNRTRHAMNNALIAIGGTMVELREPALLVAREIGPVEVDHGATGCKTPDASEYIAKMAQRAAKRTRVTGARMTGRAVSAKPRSARRR